LGEELDVGDLILGEVEGDEFGGKLLETLHGGELFVHFDE
jgi:hypothetical protein